MKIANILEDYTVMKEMVEAGMDVISEILAPEIEVVEENDDLSPEIIVVNRDMDITRAFFAKGDAMNGVKMTLYNAKCSCGWPGNHILELRNAHSEKEVCERVREMHNAALARYNPEVRQALAQRCVLTIDKFRPF